jgi:hypothetical protein
MIKIFGFCEASDVLEPLKNERVRARERSVRGVRRRIGKRDEIYGNEASRP